MILQFQSILVDFQERRDRKALRKKLREQIRNASEQRNRLSSTDSEASSVYLSCCSVRSKSLSSLDQDQEETRCESPLFKVQSNPTLESEKESISKYLYSSNLTDCSPCVSSRLVASVMISDCASSTSRDSHLSRNYSNKTEETQRHSRQSQNLEVLDSAQTKFSGRVSARKDSVEDRGQTIRIGLCKGVRLVTVDCRWWDTHVEGFDSMKNGFLPRWDQAYSALIEDLEQRGLLESTLVIAWGEFGRTPRVNKNSGRDHYPNVFSAAIAGGPVKGGRVVGSSDSKGAFPKDSPKTPQDVLATIYQHLGVNTEKHYLDHSGRPIPAIDHGSVINELV